MMPLPLPFGVPASPMPTGAIIAYAGSVLKPDSPPGMPIEMEGWLVCDGRLVPIARYPALFQVIGLQYGGSGGMFSLPDLRGQFIRGVATNTSQDPDFDTREAASPTAGSDPVGSTQADALQNHKHSYESAGKGTGAQGSALAAPPSGLTGPPTDETGTVRVSSETRPRNTYLYFLIKAY